MGAPEQEIVVTTRVKSVGEQGVITETEAAQGENRIIRNAEATLRG